MNSDEIKKTISMPEIVRRYGLHPNRSGFIACPFHKEKTASMKIYEDSYYCFGCGATGDIFSFVQYMDNCDFKTAYLSLGGEYAHKSEKSPHKMRYAKYHREQAAKTKERRIRRKQSELMEVSQIIDLLLDVIRSQEPMTDVWCEAVNQREKYLYQYEELRKEVEELRKEVRIT